MRTPETIAAGSPPECRVCAAEGTVETILHLKIYVAGSEGVFLCCNCRMVLTEVLRGMMRAHGAGKKVGYMACKSVQAAKADRFNPPGNPLEADMR